MPCSSWANLGCSNNRVTAVNLNKMGLSGTIASQLGGLDQLQNLNLYTNNLYGTIPTDLGRLSNLKILQLYFNMLTGPIPSQIGRIGGLSSINLGGNLIGGSLPSEIGRLTALSFLGLAANEIKGTLPSQVGLMAGMLRLGLHSNLLSGSLPSEIARLTAITSLLFNNNTFTGLIPSTLETLCGTLADSTTNKDFQCNLFTSPATSNCMYSGLAACTVCPINSSPVSGNSPVGQCALPCVKCNSLPTLSIGQIQSTCSTGVCANTNCAVICDSTHTSNGGSMSLTCSSSGTWNTPTVGVCNPNCATLFTLPSFTAYSTCTSNYPAGSTCSVSCVSSTSFTSGSLTATCNTNGSWTPPSAVCTPNPCPQTTSPSILNAYPSNCNSSTPSGSFCSAYSCFNGYSPSSSPPLGASCSFGSWTVSGSCNANSCPRPSDTSSTIYSVVSCPSPTTSSSTCTPQCNIGYTATTSLSQTCTLGIFSSPAGVCAPNPCSIPQDTSSVSYSLASTCASSTQSGGTCTPICQSGYTLSGNLTLLCQAGAFTSTNGGGSCNPSPCSNPTFVSPIVAGSCSTSIPSGSPCTLGCATNYVANGSLTIQCSYGHFTPPSGSCVFNPGLICSQPTPAFPFSPGNCPTSSSNGTTCQLGCVNGFFGMGDFNVTCNSQIFSNVNPSAQCIENPCSLSPSSLSVGFDIGDCPAYPTMIPGNTSCYLSCLSGFEEEGSLNVTCDAGQLSSPTGSCFPNPCLQPTPNSLAAQTIGDCGIRTASGDSCSFGCQNDYTLIGSLTELCFAGTFSNNSAGYCVGIANVSTSASSTLLSPPLIVGPGSIISIDLSPSMEYLPSDILVSNYSVNGSFADSHFGMPNLHISSSSIFTNETIIVYVSSVSMGIVNYPLDYQPSFFYVSPPTSINSACPNQILALVNQLVVVQGTGFIPSDAMRCILNGTIASIPVSMTSTAVTCDLYWPIAEDLTINLTVSNDGSLSATRSTTTTSESAVFNVQIEIVGLCQTEKPGSFNGPTGCECPAGTFDTGTSCLACADGYYQNMNGQTQCLPCGNNQNTNGVKGSISHSACVCVAAYYFNDKTKSCQPCVQGMFCPGDNVIDILPGYWRANNQTADILVCPGGKLACVGTTKSPETLCALGYRGPICTVCEKGYARFGVNCSKCPKTGLNVLALIVLIFFALLLGYFLVSSAGTGDDENGSSVSSLAKAERQREGSFKVLFKVSLNFLQLLYYIGRLATNWSDLAHRFFSAIGIVGALSPNNYTIACAVNWKFYETLIFVYVSPIIIVVVLAVIYIIRHFVRRLNTKVSLTDFQMATMLILYQVHPTIMLELIGSFPCESVPGTDSSYLRADMSVNCKSSEYYKYAAISAVYLVFYIFGMVLAAFERLRYNHRKGKLSLTSHNAYRKYAFFISGYRNSTYYWEAVIMLRKMGVVAFSVLSSAALQLVFANVIVVTALLFNNSRVPFASHFVNQIESLSLIVLYITITLGFFYIFVTGNTVWIDALLILVNAAMCALLFGSCVKRLQKYVTIFEDMLPEWLWQRDGGGGGDGTDAAASDANSSYGNIVMHRNPAKKTTTSSASTGIEMAVY